ncbi:MAG: hypothetical protein LC105_05140 [Chitinophagales bacterium]|nr:hypothetical protein [Chitinophagales bacterium]MCZ2393221.1 hypothetical protein [Chitinophagales bacterium]
MKKVFILSLAGLLILGCRQQCEHHDSHQGSKNHSEHHQAAGSETIELNNGEKWIVNEEMKPFVLKGSQMVDEYIQRKGTDYKKLASDIEDQNNQLINSCTMDGKSHDELHKWLHPHLELVDDLKNASSQDEANQIIIKLQESNKIYHQFFN